MMNIRAKFKCESVLKTEYGEKVSLGVVQNGSEENKLFTKYTPSGRVDNLHIDKDAPAYGKFEAGKEYLVDFTEVTPAEY